MKLLTTILIAVSCVSCAAQSQEIRSKSDRFVGGGCDGCDLIYEGMPSELDWKAVIPPSSEPGEPMVINGTIYKKDGRTPAPDVILYLFHTDHTGAYSPSAGQTTSKRHGHLRGWMKTNTQGQYQFTTIRPVSYPGRKIPAHIHPSVKETGVSVYYIDEYLFDDDPFLTPEERARQEKRGGDGIIKLTKNAKGQWVGKRDIVLGLNIPGY